MRTFAQICLLSLFGACDAGARVEPPPPLEIAKPVAHVDDLNLAYLPGDADLVLRIDVTTLRESKLWQKYEHVIARAVDPSTTACAYEPLDEVTSVMIGVSLKLEHELLVFRGIDRDKMMACLRRPEAIVDGRFTTVKNKSTFDVLTFVDAKTMVVERAKVATRPALEANTIQDTALIGALRKLPPKAGFGIVTRPGSEELDAKWTSMGVHLREVYGTVVADDKLTLELAIVLKSADEATQMTNMMRAQLKTPQITALVDRIDVNGQDRTITLELVLGEPKLGSLVSMLGGMF